MSDDQLNQAREILAVQEKKYRDSSTRWKVGYRLLLVFSALLATTSAIVSKLSFVPSETGEDLSSILAGCAAVMTTLLAALDFESNSRINRRSRHQVQILLLDAEKTGANADTLLDGLKEVVSRRTHDLDKTD